MLVLGYPEYQIRKIVMKILVLNSGSSSVKYQMIDAEKQLCLAKGVVERIGMAGAMLTHKLHNKDEIRLSGEILDHKLHIGCGQ